MFLVLVHVTRASFLPPEDQMADVHVGDISTSLHTMFIGA